jgi:hypothetical protein
MALEDEEIPAEVIEKLKEQYGEFIQLQTKAGPLAFRSAKRAEYQMWLKQSKDPKESSVANDALASKTVIYVSGHVGKEAQTAFMALLDKRPGIATMAGDQVALATGLEQDPIVKKFE